MKHIINWRGGGEYIVAANDDGITMAIPSSGINVGEDFEVVNFFDLESAVLYCAPVAGEIEINMPAALAAFSPETEWDEKIKATYNENAANKRFYQ